jgi:sugar phosphate isomerase/epimerase
MTRDLFTRRSFLAGGLGVGASTILAGGIGQTHAIEPIRRAGKQKLKLSLAAYSLRNDLPRGNKKTKMDMLGFLDYCASLGTLDGAELTSYFFPNPVKPEFLNQIKRKAHILGLDISGGAIGNNFTHPAGDALEKQLAHLKTWIDHYADMGAPVIRVFAGKPPKGISEEQGLKNAITNLKRACAMAGKRGVILGIENHDFTTNIDRLMEVVKGVDSPWFGVNFDSGNLAKTDDPYRDLARIAPYTVNAQIKVLIPRNGKREPADLKRVVDLLRKGGYSGYIVLEYEDKEDPYKAIPRYLKQLRKIIDG